MQLEMKRYLLSLCLSLTLASLSAQGAVTAADCTEPGRSLDRALNVVLGGSADTDGKERNLIILVDATTTLRSSGFADSLAAAFERKAAQLAKTRLALAKVGEKKLMQLPLGSSPASIVGEIKKMLTKPGKRIQNIYADLRHLTSSLAGKAGSREVLLVTLDNGDAEDRLEATVKKLRAAGIKLSVICNEAYLADSFWQSNRYRYRRVKPPRGTQLRASDSPFIDLPWGWLFQLNTANEITPSGFAVYGISRMAAATGGRVFIYTKPSSQRHTCAVLGVCNFCSNDHNPELEIYWDARVNRLAPPASSRTKAYKAVGGHPWFRAVQRAWRAAAKAGLIRSTPPLRLSGTSARRDSRPGGRWLRLTGGLNFKRHAEKADKAAWTCQRILHALEADMHKAEGAKDLPRQKAIAELTRIMLQLSKVNLISYAAWCRNVAPSLLPKTAREFEAPEVPMVPPERTPVGISYTNLCLCHGVEPFNEVDLPGGKRLQKELDILDSMTSAYTKSYSHTPFVVALHRAGIARFHFTYRGSGGKYKRPHRKSKTAKKPDTTTEHNRPNRRGATTGGGSTGPTTGGKR